jgi:2'-5' RNA ligase
VPEEELPVRGAALAAAFAHARAPRLVLSGAGGFPEDGAPRVLWLGFEEASREALRELHVAARAARGAAPDSGESWRPHVTLGRMGRGDRAGQARAAAALGELEVGGSWSPGEVVLFESRPEPGGGRYHALGSWPLGA